MLCSTVHSYHFYDCTYVFIHMSVYTVYTSILLCRSTVQGKLFGIIIIHVLYMCCACSIEGKQQTCSVHFFMYTVHGNIHVHVQCHVHVCVQHSR